MATESEFVMIEDPATQRIIVAQRTRALPAYASRGAIVERFLYCAEFGGLQRRDRAMAFIRSETDRLAEQKREAGSRTP